MNDDFDIIVIGSGPSGVHAAQEAVQLGAQVCLIDVGHEDSHYSNITPDQPWSELRKSDPNQHRYFLGDNLEGVLHRDQKTGAQLTPARQFVTRDTAEYLPIRSTTFDAVQSLAMGGLGAGWGAGCACYEQDELGRVGLPTRSMQLFYNKVAREIGVSGSNEDDVSEHIAQIDKLQPPLDHDSNAKTILKTYARKRTQLHAKGFKLGSPMTAILTRPLGARKPNSYFDMDFWTDAGESIYRPRFTLRKLLDETQFTYLKPFLVDKFLENEDQTVSVFATNLRTKKSQQISCKRLILAAGAINSARIVLSSLKIDDPVPILSNPYTYVPAINLPMLGQKAQDRRHSMVQLTGIFWPDKAPENRVVAQFYSYRSLLLFKLAQEIPLPASLAMLFSRSIVSSLVMIGVNHADTPSSSRYMRLKKNGNGEESLFIQSKRTRTELRGLLRHELGLVSRLLSLKLMPINLIHLPEGSSIHYAGTLPFSDDERPLTCNKRGRLNGTRSVYVADGSTWKYLPAKGLTFSLMANARRISQFVVSSLEDFQDE